jgi:SAM-dependent methyltransferase
VGTALGIPALDWAASEEQQLPTYEEAIRRVGVSGGQRVLDVGCGSGVFLQAAADLGADVYGIDASEALLELARQRVPEADLRLGDIEALPYDDDCFDVVAGFNSFFFAVDLVAAPREAQRVAKPGAPGRDPGLGTARAVRSRGDEGRREAVPAAASARCAAGAGALGAGRPRGDRDLGGLTPENTFDVSWAFEYADDDELARAMLAPAGIADLVGPSHEQEVRRQIVDELAPFRTPQGGYRLENELHFLIVSA